MLLNFDNNRDAFSTGAAKYLYKSIRETDTPTPRVIVEIEIDGHEELAALDTGGVYFVCSPILAEKLGYTYDEKQGQSINILGSEIWGNLRRLDLKLRHKEGRELRIDATVFVPNLTADKVNPDFMPVSIMGLMGCLERVRFAIDPSEKTFHFGECPTEEMS